MVLLIAWCLHLPLKVTLWSDRKYYLSRQFTKCFIMISFQVLQLKLYLKMQIVRRNGKLLPLKVKFGKNMKCGEGKRLLQKVLKT